MEEEKSNEMKDDESLANDDAVVVNNTKIISNLEIKDIADVNMMSMDTDGFVFGSSDEEEDKDDEGMIWDETDFDDFKSLLKKSRKKNWEQSFQRSLNKHGKSIAMFQNNAHFGKSGILMEKIKNKQKMVVD